MSDRSDINFTITVQFDMTELSKWHPHQIDAFLRGIAQVTTSARDELARMKLEQSTLSQPSSPDAGTPTPVSPETSEPKSENRFRRRAVTDYEVFFFIVAILSWSLLVFLAGYKAGLQDRSFHIHPKRRWKGFAGCRSGEKNNA